MNDSPANDSTGRHSDVLCRCARPSVSRWGLCRPHGGRARATHAADGLLNDARGAKADRLVLHGRADLCLLGRREGPLGRLHDQAAPADGRRCPPQDSSVRATSPARTRAREDGPLPTRLGSCPPQRQHRHPRVHLSACARTLLSPRASVTLPKSNRRDRKPSIRCTAEPAPPALCLALWGAALCRVQARGPRQRRARSATSVAQTCTVEWRATTPLGSSVSAVRTVLLISSARSGMTFSEAAGSVAPTRMGGGGGIA
jgi:hypothetical protein